MAEINASEVARALEQLREDLRENFAQIRKDIADDRTRFVSNDVHAAKMAAQDARLKAVEDRLSGAFKWAMGLLGTVLAAQIWQWLQLKQAVKP